MKLNYTCFSFAPPTYLRPFWSHVYGLKSTFENSVVTFSSICVCNGSCQNCKSLFYEVLVIQS